MYYSLSLLSGFIIAVMILVNGTLTQHYGVHLSTIIIHISGLILITAVVLIKRVKPFAKRHSWYIYLGGALGVLTTVSNNVSFSRISVSALLALVLLGQSVASLTVDQFGWLGMKRRPFNSRRIFGLLLIIAGIAVMIDRFDTLAVVMSFLAGWTIVMSRTLNARLSELSSVLESTFFNYVVGLAVSIPVFLVLGIRVTDFPGLTISPNPLMYVGGLMGVCLVWISNIVVSKISAFYLSLIMFIGQVFMGVMIDAVIARSFSLTILAGGTLVTVGLCADLFIVNKQKGDRPQPPG